MTFRELYMDLTRLTAKPHVDLDAEVWVEGKNDEEVAAAVAFLPDSNRIYIMRRRNGS